MSDKEFQESMKRVDELDMEASKKKTKERLEEKKQQKKKSKKIQEKLKPFSKPHGEDLKTFIFNEDDLVRNRVFSSHLLNDVVFGYGLLLPRKEDLKDKKNEIIGQKQVWRPVVVTSNNRGLVVSKWMTEDFKIGYPNLPSEMKLRWELKDIKDYLHGEDGLVPTSKSVFEQVRGQYEKYLYFRGDEWYDINALWDMGTYLHQLFSAFPIKEERGLKGTAKSKTMFVSMMMSLNATEIMINPSESTLFRITEELRPTKYVDEAEKLFRWTKEGMEADNRVELLNGSFSRNGVVPRQEKIGNHYITKWYHVYSPTRIGSINGLFGATEDRAITQIHTKAPDSDSRGELDPEDDIRESIWKKIRNSLYRWALSNWSLIHVEYSHFSIKTKLKKRDFKIWKPLLVLAKIIDEQKLLPKIIAYAERVSVQKKQDNLSEGTLDWKCLWAMNELFSNSTSGKIYVNDIREKIHQRYMGYESSKSNKSLSIRLDKIGFKELRDKDRIGSYYLVTKTLFDEIISPITTDFSSQSSQSSHQRVNSIKKRDECVMNSDELLKKEEKKCDECDANDECDEYIDLNVPKSSWVESFKTQKIQEEKVL